MDSLDAPHLLTITNGQNHDTFENLFNFETFNKDNNLFAATVFSQI